MPEHPAPEEARTAAALESRPRSLDATVGPPLFERLAARLAHYDWQR